MKNAIRILIALVVVVLLMVLTGTIYTVPMQEQVIITQFGKPIGKPVTDAGLHLKMPFVQKVNRFEKRVLEWDGRIAEMPTLDKLYILVDTFARWRIKDPLEFFRRLKDERTAQSRLDAILGGETRNAVAKHDLIEIIRTTKDRKPIQSGEVSEILGKEILLDPITDGRAVLEKQILENAKPKLASFGIELLDVRFKRVNYNPTVERDIFVRMISERRQIAERFRSEGEGEAARILGNKERDMLRIESEAYKKVQETLGKSDAEATKIYADAYGKDEGTKAFYEFTKTLEAYESILDSGTTVILSTDSELFHLLKGEKKE
jgi:membrane protease subunit HflC